MTMLLLIAFRKAKRVLVHWGASLMYFWGRIKIMSGHKVVGSVWARRGQKVGGSSRSDVADDDVTEISQW